MNQETLFRITADGIVEETIQRRLITDALPEELVFNQTPEIVDLAYNELEEQLEPAALFYTDNRVCLAQKQSYLHVYGAWKPIDDDYLRLYPIGRSTDQQIAANNAILMNRKIPLKHWIILTIVKSHYHRYGIFRENNGALHGNMFSYHFVTSRSMNGLSSSDERVATQNVLPRPVMNVHGNGEICTGGVDYEWNSNPWHINLANTIRTFNSSETNNDLGGNAADSFFKCDTDLNIVPDYENWFRGASVSGVSITNQIMNVLKEKGIS